MPAYNAVEVRLARAGVEDLSPESFATFERELPDLGPDELLVRVRAASLDPSHRIRMKHSPAGTVPSAGIVGEVLESSSERFAVGDLVVGDGSWSTLVVLAAGSATRYEPREGIADHHAIGLLGLTGLTGYLGVTRVAMPRAGEKMVVSGAFGGVGQVACQVAVALGADVLGVVGSDDKVAALDKLGVAAVSYRSPDWVAAVQAWAPEGVDLFFDNVWGDVAARVVEQLKPLGRVALCGQMSSLGDAVVPPLPLDDWFRFVTRSLTLQGFKAADYAAEFPRARDEIAELVRAGKLQQELHVVNGWEDAGAAFCDMLVGRTFGKLVVEVA